MKNIYSLNLSDDSELKSKFIIRELDEELSERYNNTFFSKLELERNARLPLWLKISQLVSGLISALLFCFFMYRMKSEDSFLGVLTSDWWILLSSLLGVIYCTILWFIEKRQWKALLETEEYQLALRKWESTLEENARSLKIPEDAHLVDVFIFTYRLDKDGKVKKDHSGINFWNMARKCFLEGENLCLADEESVDGIPLSGLQKIVKIDKKATFMIWGEFTAEKKEKLKQNKVKMDRYSNYAIKFYYSLQFIADGEEFEILFPSYELETIKNLTGLSVEEN